MVVVDNARKMIFGRFIDAAVAAQTVPTAVVEGEVQRRPRPHIQSSAAAAGK
jgi:hypothetical protein